MFCRECGTKIPEGGIVCPNCGTAVGKPNRSENQNHRANEASPRENIPLTWGNLLRLILINTARGIAKNIPMIVVTFIISLIIHTYLLVVYNEGFAAGTWIGSQLLATRGRVISSTLLWMLVSGFIYIAVPQIKSKGLSRFLQDAFQVPGKMIEYFRKEKKEGMNLFLAALGLSLLISGVMSGVTSLVLAVGLAAMFASSVGRVVAILIQSSWYTLVSLKDPERPKMAAAEFRLVPAYISMIGGSAGFALSPFLPFSSWIGLIILVVVAARIFTKGESPTDKTINLFFFLFTLACMVLRAKRVLADDGGWQEAGGTLSTWVRSPGAVKAVLHGFGPSIGAAVGPTLIKIISAINPNDFIPQVPVSGPEPPKDAGTPVDTNVAPEEKQKEPQKEPAKQYDEQGYDKEGYDKDGYDRNGYDRQGYNREGYNREGYDREGYNRNGYDKDGYDRNGYNREGFDRYGYDRFGYDKDGYDRKGFNRQGYDREGYDRDGFNRFGYDRQGYNREGYDRFGFNQNGVNREGKTREEVRAELRRKIAELEKQSEEANSSASRWDTATKSVEWVKWGCDKSIDVLANVTGLVGNRIKDVYTVVSGTAEGLGEAIADGKDYVSHIAKGTIKGATNLGLGKVMDSVSGKIFKYTHGKIPGLEEYIAFNPKSTSAWDKVRVRFIKDALLGNKDVVDETVSNIVRDRFATASKNVIQSTVRDKLTKDQIMDSIFKKEGN